MKSLRTECASCGREIQVQSSFRGKEPKCMGCRPAKGSQPATIKSAKPAKANGSPPVTSARYLSSEQNRQILSAAHATAKTAAEFQGITVLQFLESLFPTPRNSESPLAVPERLRTEWVYSLDRSWGRAFRAVLLLLLYAGRVGQVAENDIMDGHGFFSQELHEWRVGAGFFEK